MSSRKEWLQELGYEEPFNESPVEVPDGWSGGEVRNTGGNIMCRIWRNFEGTKKKEGPALEVIYDVSQDDRVALQEYKWDGEHYIVDEVVDSTESGGSDSDQARTAQLYMRKYEKFI